MTRANRVESFKDDTHISRTFFMFVQACALIYVYHPLSLGVQGTVVDRDVSDTCVSREIFFSPPYLPFNNIHHLYTMCSKCSLISITTFSTCCHRAVSIHIYHDVTAYFAVSLPCCVHYPLTIYLHCCVNFLQKFAIDSTFWRQTQHLCLLHPSQIRRTILSG